MYMSSINGQAICNACGSTDAKPIFTKFDFDLVACAQCGLAYIANPPTPEDLAASYQSDADYHTELHDPSTPQFARMTRVAAKHLEVVRRWTKPGTLLDAGCSTGLFLDQARSAGYEVEGVEFSRASADFARSHFGLSVTDGDIHAVSAAPGSFDTITMFDVIEHVPDPMRDLAAIHRLLKPGGTFVVSTPNIDGIFPRLSLKVAKALDYWPHPEPPHHLYQFSVKTLSVMLEKAGFEAGEVHHINIDLAYSFGALSTLARMPKRALYAAAFAPVAKIGPWFGSGDWFYMAARKR